VYLDNAATTQKPLAVIEAVETYYRSQNANIHRGVYALSQEATRLYEDARGKVARFLNAREAREIVFTRGATEAVNLVAQSFARPMLKSGDEILLTAMEHHSNIVPWQLAAEQTGARVRAVPMNDAGELLMDEFERMLSPRTRLVAAVHVSNSLGTVNPVREMVRAAKARGIPTLIDAAQSVQHFRVDVRELDCDFLVFSGHKLFGPTGIGALYARASLLEKMPPYQGGGDMISSVTFEKSEWNEVPWKFEAGTPNIAGAIGLGVAIDYVGRIGLDRIAAWERELMDYAMAKLAAIDGLRIVGTARERSGVISFVLEGIHPHDIGTILDADGIAIRTGHHCCQPVMDRFGIPATARCSMAFYNTKSEIDALADGIARVIRMFA